MKTKRYPTVVSYTAYMKVLCDNNRADEATDIYKQMLQCGLTPTCHTYNILMVHLISSVQNSSRGFYKVARLWGGTRQSDVQYFGRAM
ncbi:hypothetical protein RND81_13G166100 [Saponaria officinalis]|uniref:Pentatricopeptide repeat-containing protein n=1 Tax=Saponaria officinalis TaxID=3572 RepID=A0AAW1H1D3_SAPOF